MDALLNSKGVYNDTIFDEKLVQPYFARTFLKTIIPDGKYKEVKLSYFKSLPRNIKGKLLTVMPMNASGHPFWVEYAWINDASGEVILTYCGAIFLCLDKELFRLGKTIQDLYYDYLSYLATLLAKASKLVTF